MFTDNHYIEAAADEYVGHPEDYDESYTTRWSRQAFFDGATWFRDEVSPWRVIANPPRKSCECLVRTQSGIFHIATYNADKKHFTSTHEDDPITEYAVLQDLYF